MVLHFHFFIVSQGPHLNENETLNQENGCVHVCDFDSLYISRTSRRMKVSDDSFFLIFVLFNLSPTCIDPESLFKLYFNIWIMLTEIQDYVSLQKPITRSLDHVRYWGLVPTFLGMTTKQQSC